MDMAKEVLPVATDTPALAGVNGTDPFYDPEVFLDEVSRVGFSGVQTSRPWSSSSAPSGPTWRRPG
jgi:predicted TIM-barrel enzyme